MKLGCVKDIPVTITAYREQKGWAEHPLAERAGFEAWFILLKE